MRPLPVTVTQPVIGEFCVKAASGWTIKASDQAQAAQIARMINSASDTAYAAGRRDAQAIFRAALGLTSMSSGSLRIE
jgi:hypothetical protein